jgi:hypothetical protein
MKSWYYIPEFCVVLNFIDILVGPSQMPIRTMLPRFLYVPGFYATVGQSPQKYNTGVSMYKQDTYFPNTFFMKSDINLLQ